MNRGKSFVEQVLDSPRFQSPRDLEGNGKKRARRGKPFKGEDATQPARSLLDKQSRKIEEAVDKTEVGGVMKLPDKVKVKGKNFKEARVLEKGASKTGQRRSIVQLGLSEDQPLHMNFHQEDVSGEALVVSALAMMNRRWRREGLVCLDEPLQVRLYEVAPLGSGWGLIEEIQKGPVPLEGVRLRKLLSSAAAQLAADYLLGLRGQMVITTDGSLCRVRAKPIPEGSGQNYTVELPDHIHRVIQCHWSQVEKACIRAFEAADFRVPEGENQCVIKAEYVARSRVGIALSQAEMQYFDLDRADSLSVHGLRDTLTRLAPRQGNVRGSITAAGGAPTLPPIVEKKRGPFGAMLPASLGPLRALLEDERRVEQSLMDVLHSGGSLATHATIRLVAEEGPAHDAVISVLKTWGAPAAGTAISLLQEASKDPVMRRAGADLLGIFGADPAVSSETRNKARAGVHALSGALHDSENAVRKAALQAIGNLQLTELLPELAPLLKDEDAMTRAACIKSVAQLAQSPAPSRPTPTALQGGPGNGPPLSPKIGASRTGKISQGLSKQARSDTTAPFQNQNHSQQDGHGGMPEVVGSPKAPASVSSSPTFKKTASSPGLAPLNLQAPATPPKHADPFSPSKSPMPASKSPNFQQGSLPGLHRSTTTPNLMNGVTSHKGSTNGKTSHKENTNGATNHKVSALQRAKTTAMTSSAFTPSAGHKPNMPPIDAVAEPEPVAAPVELEALEGCIDAIAGGLEDLDSDVRAASLQALSCFGAKSAKHVVKMMTLLRDDSKLRAQAVTAIGQIGDAASASVVDMLHKPNTSQSDGTAHVAALDTLAAMGDVAGHQAQELAKLFLQGNAQICEAAKTTLRCMGPRAADSVASLLSSEEGLVRWAGCVALGCIGTSAVAHAPQVAELVRIGDGHTSEVAIETLGLMGKGAALHGKGVIMNALRRGDRVVRRLSVEALGRFGPLSAEYAPAIAHLMSGPVDEAKLAVIALGEIGPEASEHAGEVARLLHRADGRFADTILRRNIADTLGLLGVPEYAPALARLLVDTQAEVRKAAADALRKLKAENHTDDLARLLYDHDGTVRATAVTTLASFPTAASRYAAQIAEMLSDSDPGVRVASACTLPYIVNAGDIKYAASFAGLLRDGDSDVRRASVIGLGHFLMTGNATQYASEVVMLLRDRDAKVRCAAAEAVGELGQPVSGMADEIVGLLQDPAGPVRRAAAESLGRLSCLIEVDMQKVAKLLNDGEASVRCAALRTLARLAPKSRVLVAEVAALLDDENTHVREAAAAALGDMGPATLPYASKVAKLLSYDGGSEPLVATKALGQMGAVEYKYQIAVGMKHEHRYIRKAAVEALALLGPAAARCAKGVGLRLKDPDIEVVVAAVHALGKFEHGGGVVEQRGSDRGPARVTTKIPNSTSVKILFTDYPSNADKPATANSFDSSVDDSSLDLSGYIAAGKPDNDEPASPKSVHDELMFEESEVLTLSPVEFHAEEIIKLLNHSDVRVRRAALEALGCCGPKLAHHLDKVIVLLEDNDEGIRSSALDTLGKLGVSEEDAPMEEVVLALVDEDAKVRMSAIEVLVVWRDFERIGQYYETITKMTHDKNWAVRYIAQNAIRSLDNVTMVRAEVESMVESALEMAKPRC